MHITGHPSAGSMFSRSVLPHSDEVNLDGSEPILIRDAVRDWPGNWPDSGGLVAGNAVDRLSASEPAVARTLRRAELGLPNGARPDLAGIRADDFEEPVALARGILADHAPASPRAGCCRSDRSHRPARASSSGAPSPPVNRRGCWPKTATS